MSHSLSKKEMKIKQLKKDGASKDREIETLKRENSTAKNESYILKQYSANTYK